MSDQAPVPATAGRHRYLCTVGIDIDATSPQEAANKMATWLSKSGIAICVQRINDDRQPVGDPISTTGWPAS